MYTMTFRNGETMAKKWPYTVAGVAVGGAAAVTLQLLDLVDAPHIRVLGPAMVLGGGLLGTAVMKWRHPGDEGPSRP